MKIEDVDIYRYNGKVVLARVNKRGQVKGDYKDITKEFIGFVKQSIVTKEKYCKRIKHDGKEYAVTCEEIPQEILDQEKIDREQKSVSNRVIMDSFYNIFVRPRNDLFDLSSPVRLKDCHKEK